MSVKISDLRVGDIIQASWLGSGWHKVFDIRPSYADSRKLNLNIEGFGNTDIYMDEYVDRK